MNGLAFWWQTRTSRERGLLGGLVVLVVVLVGQSLLWRPAADHVDALQRELPVLGADLEQMQGMAAALESRSVGVKREAPLQGEALVAALDKSLREAGIETAVLTPQAGRVLGMTCRDVPFSTMVAWLDRAGRVWGVHVSEAHVERSQGLENVNARLRLEVGG